MPTSALSAGLDDRVLLDAAERQLNHLQALREGGGTLDEVAGRLRDTLELREELDPDRGTFTSRVLVPVPVEDRARLLNQAAPGTGRIDATLIAIGTEQAFELGDSRSLTLQNLAITALRLCGSRADVVAKLADEPSWASARPSRPFHEFPNGYYGERAGAGETSSILTMVVTDLRERAEAARSLHIPGDHAYQSDLSVHPSKAVGAGRVPTEARIEALTASLGWLRSTARVLLLHGSTIDPWARAPAAVIGAFLDADPARIAWTQEDQPHRRLRWAQVDSHLVVLTRALSQDVSDDYVRRVRELVSTAQRP